MSEGKEMSGRGRVSEEEEVEEKEKGKIIIDVEAA